MKTKGITQEGGQRRWRTVAFVPKPFECREPQRGSNPSNGCSRRPPQSDAELGWHSSVQGYFTTEGAEMKKARVVGHPGGNSRVKRLELSEPSEAKAPA